MRLLAISPTGVFSGAERVLVRYAAAATDAGWDVTVASPSGAMVAEVGAAGAHHLQTPELKLGAGHRAMAAARLVGRNLRAAPDLRAAARDADVVLVNSVLALPIAAAVSGPAPIALLVHDVLTRGDLLRVARAFARHIDLAIGVSEVAAAPYRRLGRPTTVVPNGVPWPAIGAEPTAEPVVGLSAVLTPWKGQDVFLDAVAQLDPSVRAELLGGPMPKDEAFATALERRSNEPDLAGRVRFVGHHDDPLSVMRSWTVSVSASVEPEAAPLVVLEAMSLGVPTVVTDHGGAAEVAAGTGELAAPGDADDLANAIERMLRCEDRRARSSAAGRARIASHHTIDASNDRFLHTLANLAANR